MKTRTPLCLVPAAVLALMAGAALAQASPQTSPRTAPAASTVVLDAQLRARGEAYHRAPDSSQNPVELTVTQRLNSDVAARNAAADRQDATTSARNAEDEAAYQADQAQYREDAAETQAENADRAADARAVAAFNADQRARYEKAMADWRATMRACETGDTARCRAGQQRPIVTDF
ncbi:MAG: cell wall hydrolase [Brevundimonas sp.]|nr:cell wall hydrolase [Brevundimonas sp.]